MWGFALYFGADSYPLCFFFVLRFTVLFGSEFYARLEKMPAWRHSLFALVLATRQFPNFCLWASLHEDSLAPQLYLNALRQAWLFHADKFNHIDLVEIYEEVEPHLPVELPEESAEGDAFAYDCGVLLDAALEGVPHNAKYGLDASTASMASVIRLCEHKYPDKIQGEESLLELDEIGHELEFQVELLLKVLEPRTLENIRELFALAIESHVSNIGLENPLTAADFPELFDPRLDEQAKEGAEAALAHEVAQIAAAAEAEAQAKARAHAQRVAARAVRAAVAAAGDVDESTESEASAESAEVSTAATSGAAVNPYQNSPRAGDKKGKGHKAKDKFHKSGHGHKGHKGEGKHHKDGGKGHKHKD